MALYLKLTTIRLTWQIRAFATSLIHVSHWNTAVNEAEKVVGYSTSFLNLRWLLNDELANVAVHLRKLIGTDHPLLHTARDIFAQQTDLPAFGLIVLLVSKAAGLNSEFPEVERDVSAGILYSQRALAEISEMIHKSVLIHRCLAPFSPSDKALNFGNKMALLTGDYLLCRSYRELALLKNQQVNELISCALRDLVDCEFIPPRDKQNAPLPAKPKGKSLWNLPHPTLSPLDTDASLGAALHEWTARSTLAGGTLLARACQCTLHLAGHPQHKQTNAFNFGLHLALARQAYMDREAFKRPPNVWCLIGAPVLFTLEEKPELYEEIVKGSERVGDVDLEVVVGEVMVGGGLEKTKELQLVNSLKAMELMEGWPDECSSLTSVSIDVPKYVKSGDTVTLSCNYDLEGVALYVIKWYKDDEEFYRYVPKVSPPYRAYLTKDILVDLVRSGPNTVTLVNVVSRLTGDYKCEISSDAPLFHTAVREAHMEVIDLPNGNLQLEAEPKEAEVGDRIVATCECPASSSVANFTWFVNGVQLKNNTDGTSIRAQKFPNKETNSITSSLELIARSEQFKSGKLFIRCEAGIYDIWKNSAVVRVEQISKMKFENTPSPRRDNQKNAACRLYFANGVRYVASLLLLRVAR